MNSHNYDKPFSPKAAICESLQQELTSLKFFWHFANNNLEFSNMRASLKMPLASCGFYWILTFKVNKLKLNIDSVRCRRLICRRWSVAVGRWAPPWWNMSDRLPGSWLMPSSVSVEMMEASPSAPWRTTDLSLRAPEDTHHPDYISATDPVWCKQN